VISENNLETDRQHRHPHPETITKKIRNTHSTHLKIRMISKLSSYIVLFLSTINGKVALSRPSTFPIPKTQPIPNPNVHIPFPGKSPYSPASQTPKTQTKPNAKKNKRQHQQRFASHPHHFSTPTSSRNAKKSKCFLSFPLLIIRTKFVVKKIKRRSCIPTRRSPAPYKKIIVVPSFCAHLAKQETQKKRSKRGEVFSSPGNNCCMIQENPRAM
jgi:hypothetical protein